MHEVLVNRIGGLRLPRKSVVRLTDRPDMTLDVYCGRKTTQQQQQQIHRQVLFVGLGEYVIDNYCFVLLFAVPCLIQWSPCNSVV